MKKLFLVYLFSVFSGVGSIGILSVSGMTISTTDLIAVLLILLFSISLMKEKKLKLVKGPEMFLSIIFISILIVYPLLGVMIYNYPLNYLTDIFNWILVLIMLFIGINLYSGRAEEFLNDILFILKISVVGHFIFVALQFLNTNTSLNFNYLLDLRFADSDMKYGHINRFTGGFGSISALGILSVFANIIFLERIMFHRNMSMIWFILSMFTLISSGQRTSFIIWTIYFSIFMIIFAYKNRKLYRYVINSVIILFTVGIGSYFAWVLNLGRIQSQFSRIKTLLDMFLFRASLNEASGRTVRWHGGVNYLFEQNKDIFGLMANPGHAFPGDPIDSYYVIMLVQGGPILVVFFSILMFILLRKSLKIYTKNPTFSHISVVSFVVLIIGAFSQAILNSALGKAILIVGLISMFVCGNDLNNKSFDKSGKLFIN